MKKLAAFLLVTLVTTNLLSAAESPETAARRYEKDLGIEIRGVSCTQVDTDNDGYVTCTVSVQSGDKVEFQSIQCAANRAVDASGCETSARNTEGCKPTSQWKQ